MCLFFCSSFKFVTLFFDVEESFSLLVSFVEQIHWGIPWYTVFNTLDLGSDITFNSKELTKLGLVEVSSSFEMIKGKGDLLMEGVC